MTDKIEQPEFVGNELFGEDCQQWYAKQSLLGGVIRPISRYSKCSCPWFKFWRIDVEKGIFECSYCKQAPRRYLIDIFDQHGIRRRVYSDETGQALDTFERCLKLLLQIRQEIKDRTFNPDKYKERSKTAFHISVLTQKYIAQKIDTMAPSYKKDFKRLCKTAVEKFPSFDVRCITKGAIEDYKDFLYKEKNLADKTVKNYLDHFKTFLIWCQSYTDFKLPEFPVIEYVLPDLEVIKPDIIPTLLNHIEDTQDKAIMGFLLTQGIRPGEACALKIKNVLLPERAFKVTGTFSANVLREKKRKGKKSKSVTIPIRDINFDYIAQRCNSAFSDDFLFVDSENKHYTGKKLNAIWDIIQDKANLPASLKLYNATKHSVLSALVNAGASTEQASACIGVTPQTAERHYIQRDLNSKVKTFSLLDEQKKREKKSAQN
jgi:integrase